MTGDHEISCYSCLPIMKMVMQ